MTGKKLRHTGTHERIFVDETVRGSTERAFGLVFAVVFAALGLWPLQSGETPHWLWIALAGAMGTVALVQPALLAPLNRLWFRFGLLLNKITSPLIMGLLFYGVMTPYAYVLRWLGKDLLRLRFDPTVESYWIERKPPGPAPETIKRQF